MACENMNRWAATFDLNKVQLYPLERCSAHLFQTKDVIHSGRYGNEDMHGRLPIYHVWVDDKEVYCGQSLQHAYAEYRVALGRAVERSYIG